MKSLIINFKKTAPLCLVFLIVGLPSCDVDEVLDPNGSSLEGVINNASRSDLQTVVTGIESLLRKEIGFYYDLTSIVGRDLYFFTGSDPRFTGEIMGKGDSQLDNAGFYSTRPYAGRYRTVKNANILIAAVNNNANDLSLSGEEVNGFLGFAKTIQAYELHLALNLQFENGIRLDVSDPDNLGPFVSYEEGLRGIMSLLDEAAGELASAGTAFPFSLSAGFDGFNTPSTFLQFVNALAARIAIYQKNKSAALGFLNKSFMNMDGDFNTGPARTYSTAGGEESNPLFRPRNQAEALVAQPNFVTDLDPNDLRGSKIIERDEPITLDGLTGTHDVVTFPSLSSPIPYINNEELILIFAEANIGTDNAKAVQALDVIRTRNGLQPYSGATSDAALIDEMLSQRRFSLYGQGHRWVDMRRYDRLDQLPLDRDGDNVWKQMLRPVSEN